MKRVFNKEKCINDLKDLNPIVCELSKGWIDICDGKEVIDGYVTGNKGEKYLVNNDWTDVVEEPAYKEVFSKELIMKDFGKSKGNSPWVIDCDGAEVIDGYAFGKSGRKYIINKDWIKRIPVENRKTPATDDWLREDKVEEPKKEVKKKTKYFFSKELYLAAGESYYHWVDDCDGAEVINGMAMGKSGTEYYMLPEWLKTVPVEEKPTEKKNATKKIFSKDVYLKNGESPNYLWVDDCDGAEVIDGMAQGKSGKTYYMSDSWVKEVPVTAEGYKIEINCNDNKTTTATLYKNGEKVNEAIARCHDGDTYDLFKGAVLALERLLF